MGPTKIISVAFATAVGMKVFVRGMVVMCICYGVYFGILTRDVAEVK